MQLANQREVIDQNISPYLRAALIDSLFETPAPMLTGVIFGAFAAALTALRTGEPLIWACVALLLAAFAMAFGTRRVEMAAWSIGLAQRALDMMCEYAPQRITFGQPLSERQAIQWWVADAATKIHAARLMTYDCARKLDRGQEARVEISMIKSFAVEMAWEVGDHAMQTFGATGMTKELPLQLMANRLRTMRIYDGPTEVHKWVIARNLLGTKR